MDEILFVCALFISSMVLSGVTTSCERGRIEEHCLKEHNFKSGYSVYSCNFEHNEVINK